MTDLQVVGSTPLSSFVSIGDYAVYQETTSSSNGNDVDGKIIRLYNRGPDPWRARIGIVVFASLVAVAVLIVKCVAAIRIERGKSVIERSLSEKAEDVSDFEDDIQCAVEEGSENLSLPQESTSAGGQEDDAEPPSAKRARLDLSSADGGAGETSRTSSETAAAAGLVMLSQQPPAPSPSSETHVAAKQQSAEEESPSTPDEAAAAAGLLMLSEQPSAPSPSSETHVVGSQQSAEESPSTPDEASAAAGLLMLSEQQPQASLSPSAVEAGETSASSASPASPSSPQPSTSSGLSAQRRDFPVSGLLHAFARLPTLDDPNHGVVFNPERADISLIGFPVAHRMFQRVRELFARNSLSPKELAEVVRLVEELTSHTISNETLDTSQMTLGRSVNVLGCRFLVLDVVMCTLQLLGTSPEGNWWDQITGGFPHAVPARKPFQQRTGRDQQQFRRSLAEKLSLGIQTMKTGTRLSAQELVELKRLIFCSFFTTPYFQQKQWDP